MNLDRFLNLTAAVFGAMGSLYVLKGIASLSPDLIERLSRTYFGFNAAQIDALTAQKADSIVGIALVIIALAVAVVTIAVVPPGIRFVERQAVAIALVAVLAGGAYLALALIGEAVHRQQRLSVGRIITAQEIRDLIERKRLPKSEVGSLRVYARTLLGWKVEDSDPPRELFERLAAEVGLQVPDGFDFSEVEGTERK